MSNKNLLILLLVAGGLLPASTHSRSAEMWAEAQISVAKPYVQQTLIYLVMVVSKAPLAQIDPTVPAVTGAVLERLDDKAQTDRYSNYYLSSFRYALTPLTLGKITIPPTQFKATAQAYDEYNGGWYPAERMQAVELATSEVQLQVQPPMPMGQKTWLPLVSLKLKGELKKSAMSRVGEPLTLTLTLNAVGMDGSQLPSLTELLQSEDFKIYPERPQIDRKVARDDKIFVLTGQRTETYTLIPQRSGALQLPRLEVHWWDTGRKRAAVADWKAPLITVSAEHNRAGREVLQAGTDNPLSTANLIFWLVTGAAALFFTGWWTGAGYPGGGRLRGHLYRLRAWLPAYGQRLKQQTALQWQQQWQRYGAQMAAWVPPGIRRAWRDGLSETLLPKRVRMLRHVRRLQNCGDATACAEHIQDFAHRYLHLPAHCALSQINTVLCRLYPERDAVTIGNLFQELEAALYAPGRETETGFIAEVWSANFHKAVGGLPLPRPSRRLSGGLPPLNPVAR